MSSEDRPFDEAVAVQLDDLAFWAQFAPPQGGSLFINGVGWSNKRPVWLPPYYGTVIRGRDVSEASS